jgi:hypothetical protein
VINTGYSSNLSWQCLCILQGRYQIRGFKLRLPVDVQFTCLTANPEDYESRGKHWHTLKIEFGFANFNKLSETLQITLKQLPQQEAKCDRN